MDWAKTTGRRDVYVWGLGASYIRELTVDIIYIWRIHEIMSPRTGSRVNTKIKSKLLQEMDANFEPLALEFQKNCFATHIYIYIYIYIYWSLVATSSTSACNQYG